MKYHVFNKGAYEDLYKGLKNRFDDRNLDVARSSGLPWPVPNCPALETITAGSDPRIASGHMHTFSKEGSTFSFDVNIWGLGFFFPKSLVEISEEGLNENEFQIVESIICKYAMNQGYKIKRL